MKEGIKRHLEQNFKDFYDLMNNSDNTRYIDTVIARLEPLCIYDYNQTGDYHMPYTDIIDEIVQALESYSIEIEEKMSEISDEISKISQNDDFEADICRLNEEYAELSAKKAEISEIYEKYNEIDKDIDRE